MSFPQDYKAWIQMAKAELILQKSKEPLDLTTPICKQIICISQARKVVYLTAVHVRKLSYISPVCA